MKKLFTVISLILVNILLIGQEVTEYTDTSELNLDPNEYNIIMGDIIIMSNNVVLEPGDQVEIVASQSITLSPGFHAKNGSNFIARIDTTAVNAISEDPIVNRISIFPNPTKDYFVVQFNANEDLGNYLLYVADINGKILYNSKALQNHMQIDISKYSEGIYFLKTINTKTKDVYVHKIIKGE